MKHTFPVTSFLMEFLTNFWLLNFTSLPLTATEPITLMLLVAYLANTKWCKNLKKYWNPGTLVLIWEYSVRAIQWIPTSIKCFQNVLCSCALDESSLTIGRFLTSKGYFIHTVDHNKKLQFQKIQKGELSFNLFFLFLTGSAGESSGAGNGSLSGLPQQ